MAENRREDGRIGKQDDIMVSVAFYVYNEEKFVCKAIESILNQITDFKYEIIVHDDASTDSSANLLKEYEKNYPELIRGIYQNENQYQKGIYVPKKYVYPLVRGKYMAYCDGDDYWTDKYKLQKQVDFLESHPDYVMCVHGFSFLYEKTKKISDNYIYHNSQDMEREAFIKWDGRNIPQIGTWLYRSDLAINRPELFWRISVENTMTISDQPLGMYLALQGKIWYMNEIMSVWRRYKTSVSSKMIPDHAVAFTESKIKFLEASKEVYGIKYNSVFKEEIEKQKINICLFKKEYKRITQFSAFKKFSLYAKLKIYIGCISPKLYDFLREVKLKFE